jgi:hypothetical protein
MYKEHDRIQCNRFCVMLTVLRVDVFTLLPAREMANEARGTLRGTFQSVLSIPFRVLLGFYNSLRNGIAACRAQGNGIFHAVSGGATS